MTQLESQLELFSTLVRIVIGHGSQCGSRRIIYALTNLDGIETARMDHFGNILDSSPAFRNHYGRSKAGSTYYTIEQPSFDDSKFIFLVDSEQENLERKLKGANESLERLIGVCIQEKVEQSEANQKLRESQIFLDSIIQNIPNMIFVKDASHLRFVRLNKAGEEILGVKSQHLIGKTDYDLFSREQADFFTATDRKVLSEGGLVEVDEEPVLTPEGTKYLKTTKIPIVNSAGEPQYLLGISEDISKKKEMELQRLELIRAQAARVEAEKTSVRLKHLAEASTALNESLDIQSMLRSFAKTCTTSMYRVCLIDLLNEHSEMIDRVSACMHSENVGFSRASVSDLYHGSGFQDTEPRVYESLSSDQMMELIKCKEIEEEVRSIESGVVTIIPLIYQGVNFGALTLISSQAEYEENPLDLSFGEDLARRASLAIQNAKLYSRAHEASRAKSSFLANISHEVRTPLGAILGFAELALEGRNLSVDQREHISTIVKNGQQLLHIVDEILDLSKVESDKVKIENIVFSLPRLMEEIYALFKMKIEAKGLSFHFEMPDDTPTLLVGDPTRIRQILVNLIGNAVKFTERGVVSLSVLFSGGAEDSDRGYLTFTITDTGVGISPGQAAKLFQPFAQADDSTSRVFGGTGLGLFLSRKLALLMGGDVVLEESTPQIGSRFRVTVEAALASEMVLTSVSETHESSTGLYSLSEKLGSSPKRILVVDDSPDNRALIKGLLKQEALSIDLAGNGFQGVESALSRHYDLVLMDIQMPEMDGFEALRALRERGYRGAVVALTAHAMKGDREKCLDQGFDDYLCKPISRKSLCECLSKNIHH